MLLFLYTLSSKPDEKRSRNMKNSNKVCIRNLDHVLARACNSTEPCMLAIKNKLRDRNTFHCA